MKKLREILNGLGAAYVTLMPYSLIVTLAVAAAIILAISVGILFYHSDSENEIKADEANMNATIANSQVGVAQGEANFAHEDSNKAGKEVERVKKEREKVNQTDSSVNSDRDAQKRFCERFPDDSTCKEKR